MEDVDPDRWEAEIEKLIQELIEYDLLSGELRAEVELMIENDHYEEAGRTAVENCSRTNALAD